jgi:hypothetical protein
VATRPLLRKLNISVATLRRRIKNPPFVARRAQVNGKVVTLLCLGEAPPKDAND